MKVILFGATGMVGGGVLRECLLDPTVESVLSVARSSTGQQSPRLQELLLPDLSNLASAEDRLRGYDAAFFCLGVSSVGKSEADYRRTTYDLTVLVAETLVRLNSGLTFVYVSGAGTDSTERGSSMWARVKGQTENALLRLPFKAAYMFRPGIIQPRHGIHFKHRTARILYVILSPVVFLIKAVSPNSITATDRIGRAMIHVARSGWRSQILSTRDINEAARLEAAGSA